MKFDLRQIRLILPLFMSMFSTFVYGQQDSTRRSLSNFDNTKVLFKLEDEQQYNLNRMLRYYAITGYREGVQPIRGLTNFSSYTDKQNGTFRIYMYNLSIQDMLTHGFYRSNRVILEVKDPNKYRYVQSKETELEWLRQNGHCFELLMPAGTMANGAKILDEELGRIFGVKFGKQKRQVNALVLIRTSDQDKIKTKGNGAKGYDGKGYFNNVSINSLGTLLSIANMPPLIDETGYKGNVDLDLKINSWKDLDALRKELKKYDLDIKEEKKEVLMFVITEIG